MRFEILRTGEFTDSSGKKVTFGEATLDGLVEKYNARAEDAPIVLGHPKTNSPAYGWISKLERVGDRLIAFAEKYVPEIKDFIERGLYRYRSAAINADGSLRHVGFLGGTPPAIAGLGDVEFANCSDVIELSIDTDNAAVIETERLENALAAKEEEERKRLAAMEAELASAREQIVMLQKAKDDTAAREFAAFLEERVKTGDLLPAQRNEVLRVAEAMRTDVIEFSDGTQSDGFAALKQLVLAINNQIVMSEFAAMRQAATGESRSAAQIIADELRVKS